MQPSSSLSCMPFSGMGGLVMLGVLVGAATVIFVAVYCYQHFITRADHRHPKVFAFDFLKLLIATTVSWVVNVAFTAKVSVASEAVRIRGGKQLEGIGWYAAIFIFDVLFGTPVALVTGRFVNKLCIKLSQGSSSHSRSDSNCAGTSATDRWSAGACRVPQTASRALREALVEFGEQNSHYGKYGPLHCAGANDVDDGSSPNVLWTWWYSQTVTWTICAVSSRVLCGCIVLRSFFLVRHQWNPLAWIAMAITFFDVDCLVKQWIVVGFLRILMELLHFEIVDWFNKFKTGPTPH